jgi:uncharacterized surface protein with fasciclin (FAS1) repeats
MKIFVLLLCVLWVHECAAFITIGEFLTGYSNYTSTQKQQYISPTYATQLSKISQAFAQSTLVSLLGNSAGTYTVFLPTDSAVESSGLTISENILAYHIYDGTLKNNIIPPFDMIINTTAVHPNWLRVDSYYLQEYLFNGYVNQLATSVSFLNAIVYVIDSVLVPPCSASLIVSPTCQNAVVDAPVTSDLQYDTTLSDWMQLIDAYGIPLPNPVTMFVPDDTSFSYPPDLINYIKSNATLLKAIIGWHVVSGIYFPGYAQASGTTLTTIGGNTLDFQIVGTTQIYVGKQEITIASSMRTRTDGIIYTVYPSLYPYPLPTVLPPFTPTNPVAPTPHGVQPPSSDAGIRTMWWSLIAFAFTLFL